MEYLVIAKANGMSSIAGRGKTKEEAEAVAVMLRQTFNCECDKIFVEAPKETINTKCVVLDFKARKRG